MKNNTAKQTKAPDVKKPRKPLTAATRRTIAVLASIAWGLFTMMMVIDWLSGLYTAKNMPTLLPAFVTLMAAVPMGIAAITTKRPKLLVHLYQPIAIAGLVLIVFPLYVPIIILLGTIWVSLIWVMRTPVFWGDRGESTEK